MVVADIAECSSDAIHAFRNYYGAPFELTHNKVVLFWELAAVYNRLGNYA